MNFKLFFEASQRELKKLQKQAQEWNVAIVALLKTKPVTFEIKEQWHIAVTFENHILDLYFQRSPHLDGKMLSSSDPKDCLNQLFRAAGRKDLVDVPGFFGSRNYILDPLDYPTANQVYK